MTAPPRFELEYENCHERSYCNSNEDEDNGLNSTLTFSIGGDTHIVNRKGKGMFNSSLIRDRAMSHSNNLMGSNHKASHKKDLSIYSQHHEMDKRFSEEEEDRYEDIDMDIPFMLMDSGSKLEIKARQRSQVIDGKVTDEERNLFNTNLMPDSMFADS